MVERRENDTIEFDVLEIIHVLLGRFWLVACAGAAMAIICFLVSKFVLTPVYESTTKIYILNKSESAAVTYSDVQLGSQLTKDYAELINSRYVLEKVIEELSLSDTDYKDLLKKVSVYTPADTRIVSITVTDTDPLQAMNIADCIREVAGEHIQNVMDIDAVNVVENANMPTGKAGPSALKWTLCGGIIGVVLTCVFILVYYQMDDTIKSSEDVERYLGLSTLALIPAAQEEGNTRKKTKRKVTVQQS